MIMLRHAMGSWELSIFIMHMLQSHHYRKLTVFRRFELFYEVWTVASEK
jgi:hypothetical protein